MTKLVEIYTDGACRGNPGPGGWAALLLYQGNEKTIYGSAEHTTNNRMELSAAIKALNVLKQSCKVRLTTDSQYLRKGITEWIIRWQQQGWKTADKKPVKNADLWQELLIETQRHTIEWHWVKAHNGHIENEKVDALANRAIDEMLGKI